MPVSVVAGVNSDQRAKTNSPSSLRLDPRMAAAAIRVGDTDAGHTVVAARGKPHALRHVRRSVHL